MESRLQAQLAELSGDAAVDTKRKNGQAPRKLSALASVSRREFERKLAHLQHSISELAASDSHGGGSAAAAAAAALAAWMPGSAAFRCLACDAPLGGAGGGGGGGSGSSDSRRFLTSRGSTVASFLQHTVTEGATARRSARAVRSYGDASPPLPLPPPVWTDNNASRIADRTFIG
jgi:hypothetical protein